MEIRVYSRKFGEGGEVGEEREGRYGPKKSLRMRNNVTSGVGGVALVPVMGAAALGSFCPSNVIGMGGTGISLRTKAFFPTEGISGSMMEGNGGGTATPSLVTGLEPGLEGGLETGLD